MKRSPLIAALTAVASLTIGAMPAADASVAREPVSVLVGPSWRVAFRADIAGSAAFTDVEATSRSDAWAVGVHFHGTILTSGFAEPAGFFGGLAGIPGTSATWAASGCTPAGQHRAQARISINGKI